MNDAAITLRSTFLQHGVPSDLDLDVRICPIEPRQDGTFDIAEAGLPAVLVPLDPDNPSNDDVVAFYVERPHRWWVRATLPAILNIHAIDYASHFGQPLKIWTSPLSYLRAKGDGIVILRDDFDLRFWLGGVSVLDVETLQLGAAIERRLRAETAMPRIRVKRRDA